MDPLEFLTTLQDALKTALDTSVSGVSVSLGYPGTLEPEHVWIEGRAEGEPDYDLSNGVQSGQTVTLTVDGITTYGGTYAECRTRLTTLWDATTTAVATLTANGHADHIEYGRWLIDEGITAQGVRQLGFSRDINCIEWL